MEPYNHKVQYYETDQMGIVHHSNYIRWFEEARVDYMEKIGISYEEVEKSRIICPVLSVDAQYMRMVHFGDSVTIKTKIRNYNGIKIVFSYEVSSDRTGMVHCKGNTCHCFLKANGCPVCLKKEMPKLHEILLKEMEESK